jgi:hypothetical protein
LALLLTQWFSFVSTPEALPRHPGLAVRRESVSCLEALIHFSALQRERAAATDHHQRGAARPGEDDPPPPLPRRVQRRGAGDRAAPSG